MHALWRNVACLVFGVSSLRIDVKAPDPAPSWVTDALEANPELEEAKSTTEYCQNLRVFDTVTFPGAFCFSSTWKDTSLLTLKKDPRRKVCEQLSWTYFSDPPQTCTILDKFASTCFGDRSNKKHLIGYIPTICPQFPSQPRCPHYDILKSGSALEPYKNQIVHVRQPDDVTADGLNMAAFNASNLGFVRVRDADSLYTAATHCPSGMVALSYFYDKVRHISCTALSTAAQVPHDEYIKYHCHNLPEHFIGCIFKSRDACIDAMSDIEYVGVVSPIEVRISLSFYFGLDPTASETQSGTDRRTTEQMKSANDEEEEAPLQISMRIDFFKVAFSINEIRDNVRICSDQLFALHTYIPGVGADTSFKVCVRLTHFETYMPANGELWVKFTPYFSITATKTISSPTSLGFSGGIEYRAKAAVFHIGMLAEDDWLHQPDVSMVVRDDLKWFKPSRARPRSAYKKPPDFTVISLTVFLGLAGVYYVYMFSTYVKLKRENKKRERLENEKVEEIGRAKIDEQEWENAIREQQKDEQLLQNFKKNETQKLLKGHKKKQQRGSHIQKENQIVIVQNKELEKHRKPVDSYNNLDIKANEMEKLLANNQQRIQ